LSKFGAVFLMLLFAAALNALRPQGIPSVAPARPRVLANEALTAINGGLLFVLLAAVAITVLYIRPLLSVHYLVGFALIPPLALKLVSTGYRFMQYYRQDHDFRLAEPPPLFLRFAVAPTLVVSALTVMGTGLELWAFADRFGTWWLSAHTVSAVVFMAAMFVHLLSHLRRSVGALAEEVDGRPAARAVSRRSILLASAILGFVLAAVSLTYASPFGSSVGGG